MAFSSSPSFASLASTDPSTVQLAQNIHGPIFAGTFLNLILYGISCTQVYYYRSMYKNQDKSWMRNFIIALFLLDTVNSIFNMIYVYTTLINHFGDVSVIEKSNWLFSTDPWLTATIGAVVQCFFGWRVSVLTGNKLMAAGVIVLALVQCGAGIATGAFTIIFPFFQQFIKFKAAVIVWLVGSTCCDVYITSVLVWFLRGHKSGYKQSDDIIDRIIRATVQTGLITSIVACVDLILFLAFPEDGFHLAFNYLLAKLYTNSLLSSLNSRSGWAFSTNSHPSGQPASNQYSGGQSGGRRHGEVISLGQLSSTARPQVFVNVEQHSMRDSSGQFGTGDVKKPVGPGDSREEKIDAY